MSKKLAAVILAAGQGTRMKSQLPKVLHPVAGRPMLSAPLRQRRDVLRAALACNRNELLGVFACLEAKARAGGTPVLRPHVLVDECARLEESSTRPAAAAVYTPDAPIIGDESGGGRASLAAVFRSCTEVLVILPPGSNGRAAPPASPSDAITASSGQVPSSCTPVAKT
mgnify:CR=1 FL=1